VRIRLDEARRAFGACVRCSCDGFRLVHGKSDADVLGVRPALEHANVTLLTNAVAAHDERGRTAVTEVVVERDGTEERYAADIVVLACGAANTAKRGE
jgi:choline dehydrogenase-like flavoprotein